MRPHRVVRGSNRLVDGSRITHVGGVEPGGSAARLDPTDESFERLASAADHHHVRALVGEPVRDRKSDPLAGAGDDDVLPFESTGCHDAPLI